MVNLEISIFLDGAKRFIVVCLLQQTISHKVSILVRQVDRSHRSVRLLQVNVAKKKHFFFKCSTK